MQATGNVWRRRGNDKRLVLVEAVPVDLSFLVARDSRGFRVVVRVFGRVFGGERGDEVGLGLPPGVPGAFDVGRVVAGGHGIAEV